MKRKLLFMTAAMMLVLCMIVSASATTMYVNTANHKTLHLRDSHTNEVIGEIPYRAAVEVDTSFISMTWSAVTYNGKSGIVMSRYLSSTCPPKASKPSSKTAKTESAADLGVFKGMVKADYAVSVKPSTPSGTINLRWAPSKKAKIMGVYYSGDTLKVIAENTTWAQVYDTEKNVCGFMQKAYLVRLTGNEG